MPKSTDHPLIHPQTHLDHGLQEAHLQWLLAECTAAVTEQDWFPAVEHATPMVATFTMPAGLRPLWCALIGPRTGWPAVTEDEVHYVQRGSRSWKSRMIDVEPTSSRQVTVVIGPHEGQIILYTAYPGPAAPREPGDPSLDDAGRAESEAFWAEHALADG